jgi:hypothetical protein
MGTAQTLAAEIRCSFEGDVISRAIRLAEEVLQQATEMRRESESGGIVTALCIRAADRATAPYMRAAALGLVKTALTAHDLEPEVRQGLGETMKENPQGVTSEMFEMFVAILMPELKLRAVSRWYEQGPALFPWEVATLLQLVRLGTKDISQLAVDLLRLERRHIPNLWTIIAITAATFQHDFRLAYPGKFF